MTASDPFGTEAFSTQQRGDMHLMLLALDAWRRRDAATLTELLRGEHSDRTLCHLLDVADRYYREQCASVDPDLDPDVVLHEALTETMLDAAVLDAAVQHSAPAASGALPVTPAMRDITAALHFFGCTTVGTANLLIEMWARRAELTDEQARQVRNSFAGAHWRKTVPSTSVAAEPLSEDAQLVMAGHLLGAGWLVIR